LVPVRNRGTLRCEPTCKPLSSNLARRYPDERRTNTMKHDSRAPWTILLLSSALGLPGVQAADNPLDYDAYVRDFNSGNDAGLIEKYFAEDTVMISASGSYHGHTGMNEFLAWAHDGVREILRPVSVVEDEDNIFV